MSDPIYRIGIVGAAGYTGGELIRLLIQHPYVEIAFLQSVSQAGRAVTDVHDDLLGLCDWKFSSEFDYSVDCIFLCVGHGRSRAWVEEHQSPGDCLLIDLSGDHRLDTDWVYGLPELNRDKTVGSKRIANPGCFATAIQLGLLPWIKHHPLRSDWHIHALTGSTGAGQRPSPTTHFSRRDNNVSIYKPFAHQHEAEIQQSIRQLSGGQNMQLHFLPLRGNFSRGIFASLYTQHPASELDAYAVYSSYYADHPFVVVSKQDLSLKQVVNTNRCLLQVSSIGGRLLIISLIDNLLKGAAGQAVQNMNISLGLAETTGLQLKPTAF